MIWTKKVDNLKTSDKNGTATVSWMRCLFKKKSTFKPGLGTTAFSQLTSSYTYWLNPWSRYRIKLRCTLAQIKTFCNNFTSVRAFHFSHSSLREYYFFVKQPPKIVGPLRLILHSCPKVTKRKKKIEQSFVILCWLSEWEVFISTKRNFGFFFVADVLKEGQIEKSCSETWIQVFYQRNFCATALSVCHKKSFSFLSQLFEEVLFLCKATS